MDEQLGAATLETVRDLRRLVERAEERLTAIFAIEPESDLPEVRGERQDQIARIPELFTTEMSAGEVARRANYDEANTYTVLAALEKAGLLEVTQENPRKWRVGRQHRRNRVLRASHLVNEGEWITYGDFAIAVYGNVLTARTVGRVAAKNPTFANPHRVIGRDGVIPEGWRGFGGGPEECRRRLEADGVAFKDGKADPAHQISWETLKDRLDSVKDDEDA
jgi:alkylated DNA nucleotide flippase Atl1